MKNISALLLKGGRGSGNFGHTGRPGAVGGSGSGGRRISNIPSSLDTLRQNDNPIIQDLMRNLDGIEEASRMWEKDKKKWTDKFKKIGLIEKEKGELDFQGFENSPDIATTKYVSEVIEKNLAANVIYTTHKEISDSFPEVKSIIKSHPITSLNISGKKNVSPFSFALGTTRHDSAAGVYAFPHDFAEQGVGSKGDIYVGRDEKSWKNKDTSITFGGNVVNLSSKATYRHELGHHIYEVMDRDTKLRMKHIEFDRALERVDDTFEKSTIKKTISVYAATNNHESFAECFSAYTHPDYDMKVRKLPKEIHDFFTTEFPKKKKSKVKSLSAYLVEVKGNARSGNHGHRGRPGQIGGSGGGGSRNSDLDEFARAFLGDSFVDREILDDKAIKRNLSKMNLTIKDVVSATKLPGMRAKIDISTDYSKELTVNIYYYPKDKVGGKHSGMLEFTLSKKDCHIDLMEISSKHMNKGCGKSIIDGLEKMSKKSTIKTLSLQADISIGRYAWAKLGFDYRDSKLLVARSKANASYYASLLNDRLNLKITPKRMAEIKTQINKCKSANDFSNLKVPELITTKSKLKHMFRNGDVSPSLPMDFGKSFMLNLSDNGHGSWMAKKAVKK